LANPVEHRKEDALAQTVVFISYSHDSDAHRDQVLALAERLRLDGLEARCDQYVKGTPEQTWPRWMMDQIDEAAFVLVVCTETYYRRFRGQDKPGRGKGADWEGALITQEIYDDKSRNMKFVPVMLAAGQEGFIPEPLGGRTYYELTSGDQYQALYSFLIGQAGVEPSPLGSVKPVPKRKVAPLQFGPAIAPATPIPTMIGVPHRNPFFTGREELLSRLHQQLQKEGRSALAQAAIYGLGGIGKTQTAIEYAHRFGEHYRFVLWVVAEEEAAIRAAYASMARDLGLVSAETDQEAAVQAMKGWLSREDGWLMIFDNADEPGLLRDYLPPRRADGRVLLTSRAKSFAKVGIKDPFKVETLDPEIAVKFLMDRVRGDDQKAAGELANELGYLPLALEQAAAYIEVVGSGCEDYLAKYRRQGLELLEKGELSTDYRKTVATTWKLSFDAVREEAPASAELLNAAAFLVPDSIPIEIFTLGGSKLGDLLAQKLADATEDPLAFWEVLTPLERYSLVDRLPDDAFRLHRLTQEVVKESLGKEGRREWVGRIVGALNAAYPWVEPTTWRLCERLQPNTRAASELIRSFKLDSVEAGRLLSQAGFYAKERGDYREARSFNEHALEIDERFLGVEHPDTLKSKNNLAATLRSQGDLAGARRLQEETLEIRERVLGTEHPQTLTSRNNLAEVLRSQGDLSGARRHHEENLEILERVLGVEHPDTLTSKNNLAATLNSQGDLAGARRLHEQTLEILNRLLGIEHPNTLSSKANLATVLYDLEDLLAARKLEEQVLEARERLLGVEHPDTSLAIWNLLLTVQRLDDTEAADQLISRLRWLLDRDEASIASAQQREIRQNLLGLLKRA
jgi:tetratricopeptide (TPR) repeat protein